MFQANPTPLALYRYCNCIITLQIGQQHVLCLENSQTISFALAVRSTNNKRSLPTAFRKKRTPWNHTPHMQTSLSRLPPPSFPPREFLGHNSGQYSLKSTPFLRITQPINSLLLIAQTITHKKTKTL